MERFHYSAWILHVKHKRSMAMVAFSCLFVSWHLRVEVTRFHFSSLEWLLNTFFFSALAQYSYTMPLIASKHVSYPCRIRNFAWTCWSQSAECRIWINYSLLMAIYIRNSHSRHYSCLFSSMKQHLCAPLPYLMTFYIVFLQLSLEWHAVRIVCWTTIIDLIKQNNCFANRFAGQKTTVFYRDMEPLG